MARESRDLWSLAVEEHDKLEEDRKTGPRGSLEGESTVFFVGNRDAGKTTLILRFLEKDEPPKPTTGLEYTFGRRSRGANVTKEVTHIWELGGGTFLAPLVDLPITCDTIERLAVVLVLDLSKPEELWTTMEAILKQVRQRVNQVMSELKLSNPKLATRLQRKAWKKFGEDHPDKDMLDPLPISIGVIGTKYDVFQNFDPEKRKTICKTLRFVAHINGAALQCFTAKSDSLVLRAKQLISHFAFGTSLSHVMSMDYTKPLLIPAGSDALGQIGVPPVPTGELSRISARNPTELWKQAFGSVFPQQSPKLQPGDDPRQDPKFAEGAVDTLRMQKDNELDKYQRKTAKKGKELSQQLQSHVAVK